MVMGPWHDPLIGQASTSNQLFNAVATDWAGNVYVSFRGDYVACGGSISKNQRAGPHLAGDYDLTQLRVGYGQSLAAYVWVKP
jgi:hypothetical protein